LLDPKVSSRSTTAIVGEFDGAVWDLVAQALRNPDRIRGQFQDQANDSLDARIIERQKELDGRIA
jgi:hypothetical protein